MHGYIDLHCHWIPNIDDGAKSVEDGLAMLKGLYSVGFSTVMATPHMKPGMFENDQNVLRRAFEEMRPHVEGATQIPRVELASEHFLDDIVSTRLLAGEGLTYPAIFATTPQRFKTVLIEFPTHAFPTFTQRKLFELRRAGLSVVIAHPERYQPVWKDDRCLDPFLDAGACLLLDVCAVIGKYGRDAQKSAEKLLEEGAYEAACSDAHRPGDVDLVQKAIERLAELTGKEEAERLLKGGPASILGAPRLPS